MGKAEQLEDNNKVIYPNFNQPSVIRLKRYIKVPYRQLPLSRKNLFDRDNNKCQYCGVKDGLTIDHVVPKSRGGMDTWENVVACCQTCNVKKGNRTPREAGMKLAKTPKAPIGHISFEIKRLAKKIFPTWRKYIIGLSA